MSKPDHEHEMLVQYAIQAYLSQQGYSYLDMNRESFQRHLHDEQMRINMHLYDTLILLKDERRRAH